MARKTFVASTPLQRRAITTPIRMEVIEAFAVLKAASIADVARRIGRRPDSLYYHVRALVKAGILVDAGSRRAGKRDEALYRPVAERIALPVRGADRAARSAATRAITTLLRLSMREALAGLAQVAATDAAAAPATPRSFHVRRIPLPRDEATLIRVNRLLDEIETVAVRARHKHADDGMTPRCVVTLVLAEMSGREGVASASQPSAPRRPRS